MSFNQNTFPYQAHAAVLSLLETACTQLEEGIEEYLWLPVGTKAAATELRFTLHRVRCALRAQRDDHTYDFMLFRLKHDLSSDEWGIQLVDRGFAIEKLNLQLFNSEGAAI